MLRPGSNDPNCQRPEADQAIADGELKYHQELEAEVQRNLASLALITEVSHLTLPDPSEITLSHITYPAAVDSIFTNGFKAPLLTMGDILSTTFQLARPGHEVSDTWSEDEVRQYNARLLAGVHRNNSHVVIIKIPSPENDMSADQQLDPSAKFGETIGLDNMQRQVELSRLTEAALDEQFMDKSTMVDILIPPKYIYGAIDRDARVFIPNPNFSKD